MLTLIVRGDSHLVTADQFATLVDVAVQMIRDASQGTDVDFVLGGLHASQPTVTLAPQASTDVIDVDREFERIADRLESGIEELEEHGELPGWMSDGTAQQLHKATKLFGETHVDGLTIGREGQAPQMTRETYRTLDRVLHSHDHAVGSIEGLLVTATLNKGAHVSVREDTYGRTVRCYISRDALTNAAGLIGERVVATGLLRRDRLGRPHRMNAAKVEAAVVRRGVTVAEMAGKFTGPDSVEWLKEQRA